MWFRFKKVGRGILKRRSFASGGGETVQVAPGDSKQMDKAQEDDRKFKSSSSTERFTHKLPLGALEEYVKTHPDVFLREIGEHFNCVKDAWARALKKLEFTRKKQKIYREINCIFYQKGIDNCDI